MIRGNRGRPLSASRAAAAVQRSCRHLHAARVVVDAAAMPGVMPVGSGFCVGRQAKTLASGNMNEFPGLHDP